jgi:hypothetical protein
LTLFQRCGCEPVAVHRWNFPLSNAECFDG